MITAHMEMAPVSEHDNECQTDGYLHGDIRDHLNGSAIDTQDTKLTGVY